MNMNEKVISDDMSSGSAIYEDEASKKPLIAKWKIGVKLQTTNTADSTNSTLTPTDSKG